MRKKPPELYEVVQDIIQEYQRFQGTRLLASHKILLDNINDELQSTEDRFILELIQNAVDSRAADPVEVRFELQADRLIVANNGRPFTRQDIERICGLSGERKKKKIGYKGIGFKSVARITNNPQIYSPGCQFEFDRSRYAGYDPLWLVFPHWIDRPRPAFIRPDWVTIVLPFKETVQASDLYDIFAGILTRKTGALLLFLDDLGQLEVEDSHKGKYFSMRKRVEENGLIAIEEKNDKAGKWQLRGRWLVVSHHPQRLTPAAFQDYSQRRLKSTESSAAEVGDTKLLLAFHLDEKNSFVRKKDGPVYAFLPLEQQKSRFYFTLQADFLTDISRKALATPSDWNEWLISSIPEAIAGAIEQIKSLRIPALYPIIYEAFPLNRRFAPPFDGVMATLPARLKETRLIRTGQGSWVKPAEAVWLAPELAALVADSHVPALFPGKTGLVSPDICGKEAEKFLQGLGVTFVAELGELIEVLEKNPDWLRERSVDWLERFFDYLATARPGYQELSRLKDLPLVPLQEGRACASDGDVFFPAPGGELNLAGVRLARADLPPQILAFLREQFRLRPITPLMQVEQLVLPALAKAQANLPAEQLAAYVAQVKAYYEQTIIPDRTLQQRLRELLPLEASDGTWQPATCLYLDNDEAGRATPAAELLGPVQPARFVRSPEKLGHDFCRWLGVRLAPPVAELLLLLQDSASLAGQPAGWFQRLYDYLDREANRHELQELRRLAIIPVPEAGGARLYAPSAPVFLPDKTVGRAGPAAGQLLVDLDYFPQPERAMRFLEKLGLARPEQPAVVAPTPADLAAVREAAEAYQLWTPTEQPIAFDPEVAAIVGELRQKMGAALGDAGRLGEQLAGIWLKRSLAAKYRGDISETGYGFAVIQAGEVVARLTWLNQAGERYLPYDISVVEGEQESFYDVKSTTGPAGKTFKMSMDEWMFARDQGSSAHILLIFDALKEPKIIDIPGPYERWQQKQLRIDRFNLALDLRPGEEHGNHGQAAEKP